MATYYSWGQIRWSNAKGDVVTKNPGDKVAKTDFTGMTDDQWDQMVEGGSVRTDQYPVDLTKTANPTSPVEFWRQKIQDMENAVDTGAMALSSSVTASPGVASVEET